MHEAWKVHSVPKRVEIVCVGWTDWSLVSDDVEVYSAWIRGLWLAGEPDGAGRSALSLTQRWRKTALQVNRDAFVNTIFSLLSLTCARNEADSIREREKKETVLLRSVEFSVGKKRKIAPRCPAEARVASALCGAARAFLPRATSKAEDLFKILRACLTKDEICQKR